MRFSSFDREAKQNGRLGRFGRLNGKELSKTARRARSYRLDGTNHAGEIFYSKEISWNLVRFPFIGRATKLGLPCLDAACLAGLSNG